MVALFWGANAVLAALDAPMFTMFLWRLGCLGLLLILFTGWWLTRRQISRTERFLVFLWAVVLAVVCTMLRHRTVIAPSVLFIALPVLMTGWTIWLLVTRKLSSGTRQLGLIILSLLVWVPTTAVRMEGISGTGQPAFRWRWSHSAEDEYLAARTGGEKNSAVSSSVDRPGVAVSSSDRSSVAVSSSDRPATAPSSSGDRANQSGSASNGTVSNALVVTVTDWPAFRGANRDAVVHDLKIATDWTDDPPKALWRQRIGAGWSSMAIVGNRLFTQEQRGDTETVTCLDADTGHEVWAHEDKTRFEENLGGVGPRSTPTFVDGKIYSLGASGILNCLDAATGEKRWSRNIGTDSGADIPMWGFASSPLVLDGVVIVFAGGQSDKNLLGYRADTGELAWTAAAGHQSYSSPQLASIDGTEQVLFATDVQLAAIEPKTGTVLWTYPVTSKMVQPAIQPHPVGDAELLCSFGPDAGTMLVNVSHDESGWHSHQRWSSRNLKPFFNDFVVQDDSLYGFDGDVFCCVDSRTGERHWKQGRYGNGQVVLIADQRLLLILSEKGEVVLVAADPGEHKEIGRFQAIDGKTWNHPAIAGGRLYVRNAEEIACYQLKASD